MNISSLIIVFGVLGLATTKRHNLKLWDIIIIIIGIITIILTAIFSIK